MPWWPEYEVRESEGRLLVGRAPRVRRGNRVGLGVALLFALPLLLVLVWMGGGAPPWSMAALIGLSAAGGLWCFGQALRGGFELTEGRDIAFDRTGDRVTRKGKFVCALSSITAVDVKTLHDETRQDELILSFRTSAASPSDEGVVLLKGGSTDLAEPAARIRSYVGQARATA